MKEVPIKCIFFCLVRNEEVASAICIKQCLPAHSSKTYEFGLFIDMPIVKFPKSNIEYLRYKSNFYNWKYQLNYVILY